jgi:transcriptional regulator of NAD metabolism
MPQVKDLLVKLSKYDLDETIAFMIFDKEDVMEAVKELNDSNGEVHQELTDEEANEILDCLYGDPEYGMTTQDIINAYCDLLDRKGEPI